MDDPFAFIVPNFRCSLSSQQDQLRRSLFARQDELFSPEASRRPPSTSAAVDASRIVSAPETPILNAGASPSEENSQISNLGFSQEGNRSPEIVEILTDEEDRLREASVGDGEPSRAGAKQTPEKQSPIADQPSSSKRIRVSGGGGFSRLVNTPNPPTRDEGLCLVKRRMETPIEKQVKRNMNLAKLKGKVETLVIEDSNDDQIAENAAEDLRREERRELEDNEESENRSRSEQPVDDDDDDGWRLVLEVLALLAMEREDHHHHNGEVDFMTTVQRLLGINFPMHPMGASKF